MKHGPHHPTERSSLGSGSSRRLFSRVRAALWSLLPAKGSGASSTGSAQHPATLAAAAAGSPTAAGSKNRGLFGLVCLCVLGLAAFLGSGASPAGAVEAFPGQGFLPDSRAWEMVSPVDKNGGDVMIDNTRSRVAFDGSAISFASLVAFGDTEGTAISTDYVSRRGTSSWSTHGITPQQDHMNGVLLFTGPGDAIYEGDFSNDLTRGVSNANAFPQSAPNVATVQNLFVRDDLLTPSFGNFNLVTDSSAPVPPQGGGTPETYRPFLAGASADFSHVVFESILNLTPDASGDEPKLYEWDNGIVRLVGVLPASEGGGVVESAVAGQGASGVNPNYTPNVISDSGSRIFFTVPVEPGFSPGQLYLRQDHATTIHVNASEKSSPDPTSAPATYWNASADGSRVFFTSAEQLIEEDTNALVDLYLYDLDQPIGERLTRLSIDHEPGDAGAEVDGVFGVSEDGERVYFVARGGQLAAGAPVPANSSTPLIYLWDGGDLGYVGRLFDSGKDLQESIGIGGWILVPKTSRVTPDGGHLFFTTYSGDQIVPHDHGDCSAINPVGPCRMAYVYSADANSGAGELTCISCPPGGGPATADAGVNFRVATGGARTTWHQNRPITDDGRWAFFNTAQTLVSADNNTAEDVYRYDLSSGELRLISAGATAAADSYFMEASGSGEDVFFATRDRLSGWDIDTSYDLYDARVGGGLPEPPAPPPSCQGDACQPAPVSLNDPTPASASLRAPGDPQARRRCPKGKRRIRARSGRTRCVKRKQSAKKRSTKNLANTDRRATR